MKIILPSYMVRSQIASNRISPELLVGYEDISIGAKPILGEPCYQIAWGSSPFGARGAALETGFFWDAAHLDTHGLYKFSSFNTLEGWAEVESFYPPKWLDLHKSKYNQTKRFFSWDGVVLASQNPNDRSVLSVGSPEDYYSFFEGACKHYNRRLFIKAHPWNSGEKWSRLKNIADRYGAQMEKCDHSVLENCSFVLTYNSSFCVDCFVRDIPVAQFAPGYFYQTPAVTYTNFTYPDTVGNTEDAGLKLAQFLAWRYCFLMSMETEKWIRMLRAFSTSTSLFPLPEEFSYARNYFEPIFDEHEERMMYLEGGHL